MISWLGGVFLVIGFVILIRLFGLVEKSGEAVVVARQSYDVVRDAALNDEVKEKQLQQNAVHLLRLACMFAFGGGAAVFLPVVCLWTLDQVGWLSLDAVFAVVISPMFLIMSGVLATAALFFPRNKSDGKRN